MSAVPRAGGGLILPLRFVFALPGTKFSHCHVKRNPLSLYQAQIQDPSPKTEPSQPKRGSLARAVPDSCENDCCKSSVDNSFPFENDFTKQISWQVDWTAVGTWVLFDVVCSHLTACAGNFTINVCKPSRLCKRGIKFNVIRTSQQRQRLESKSYQVTNLIIWLEGGQSHTSKQQQRCVWWNVRWSPSGLHPSPWQLFNAGEGKWPLLSHDHQPLLHVFRCRCRSVFRQLEKELVFVLFSFVFMWFEVGCTILLLLEKPSQISASQIKSPVGRFFKKYMYTSFIVKMMINFGSFGLFWFNLGWG